jgi:squalene-hopene/tetraprenyl-beta-curcumene cyclase
MTFIAQLQGSKANTEFADQIEPGGGFIYSVSTSKDKITELESKAGTLVDSTGKSRLRTYGSMTYAGFMSYLYAELDREDPRVQDAYNWIRHNYTLDQNPGMVDDPETPQDERRQGYYYYLHMLARALHAWGDPVILDAAGKQHDWANDLIDKLTSLQKDDGRWVNDDHDRWAESDPNLDTAYAILALQYALQ